jgi:dipeptidyl aminopeptidase/acylaminoacyl peptidase
LLPFLSRPVLLLILLLPFLTSSAAAPQFELTIDNIMRGPGLVGYEPREVRWSGDGQRLFFSWKQPSQPILADYDTYVINRDGSGLNKLSDEEARLAPPSAGSYSPDKTRMAYARSGDLYLYDFTTDKVRRLTRTAEMESNPRFLRDGRRITFIRGGNLFVMALDDGSISQLTDIRTGGAPTAAVGGAGAMGGGRGAQATEDEDRKGTDSQEFVKKEEKDLLDIVRQRDQRKQEDDARRVADKWWKKPLTLRPGQTIGAMQLTPDEKYIVATVTDRGQGAIRTIVPNYISQVGYSETIPGRTKVGDTQDQSHLAIINAETGEMKMVNHGLVQPQPIADNPAQNTQAEGQQTAQQARARSDRPRERDVQCSLPLWSEDGTRAVIVGRAADQKDAWIMTLDVAAAKAKPIVALHDDAWIGGPGTPSISEGFGGGFGGGGSSVGWMKDDRTLYFQSEKTGYSHLYTVPYEGGEPKALTSGNWEVLRARLSQDKSAFYLETSEADRGEHNFYRMSAEGGERVRLTAAVGYHQAVLSRDEKFFADLYSYTTKPTELYVQENRPGAEPHKLTTSPAPEFFSYKWMEPQNLYITARDGAKVPAQLFKPLKPNKTKTGGPAVIFVHGAGYAQAVHRGWPSYYHEYMFHNFLAEHGYTVLLLDYRASAGSGRDWRTAVYRHMGGKDLDDNVDAARWLVKEQGVDPKRIGIYGGSYGGFLTLMAMFKEGDVFAAGAAMRPVTDWAHYNHPYTSAILNNPQKDAEAYKQSSPIFYAEGLKGALLICHGIVDTNVHFQDTVRLVQRLIELRKENFQVAFYPVEDHGFVQPTSWADEYKRIFKLFEDNLKAPAKTKS